MYMYIGNIVSYCSLYWCNRVILLAYMYMYSVYIGVILLAYMYMYMYIGVILLAYWCNWPPIMPHYGRYLVW